MNKLLLTTFLVTGPFLAEVQAIDLTPHPAAMTYGNVRINRYFFDDSGKQMAFRIDNNTTVRGSSSSAAFKFNDIKNAEMQIRKSSRSPETAFADKGLEVYRADARSLLPENASDVQLDREISAAIPINGWTSYQFVFTYKLFGLNYRRSVTFLNYNTVEQLVVDVNAPDPQFQLASLRSYQVLNSLSELRPGSSGTT